MMKFLDSIAKIALITIAASLVVLVFQPLLVPSRAMAGDSEHYDLFVEPGTTTVKTPDGTAQFMGRVMIDMRNGRIWGFPTNSSAPYPVDATTTTPPVSHPVYLGKFDLAATTK